MLEHGPTLVLLRHHWGLDCVPTASPLSSPLLGLMLQGAHMHHQAPLAQCLRHELRVLVRIVLCLL